VPQAANSTSCVRKKRRENLEFITTLLKKIVLFSESTLMDGIVSAALFQTQAI
jgi:hypothetical protein